MEKRVLIELVRDEFARLLDAIAGMDEPALTRQAIGDWGVREVLSHIDGWTRVDTEIMRRLARDERPLPEGDDYGTGESRNPGFAEAAAAKSARKVIEELLLAFDEFFAAVEAVPEERFAEGRTARRVMQDSAWKHVKEHRTEIEAYRFTEARCLA